MEEEQMEESCLNPNADICTQLMQRYSSSSAPQHRHLLAAASALKSIILQQPDSLSLSPLSYFAAAMSSLSSSSSSDDISSSSALSTLLSLSLPLVPRSSLPPLKAADAATVLVRVLDSVSASASSAKCVLKSLGLLLAFIDLSSWDSLRLPFHTLLLSSLDKRPKVRKCALLYLQNALMSFPSGFVTDKASDLILSSLQNCMSTASDTHHQPHCSDILYLLGVVRVALPYLSDQVSVKLVKILVDLLNAGWFSASPLPILTAIEAFFQKADIGVFTLVAEDIVAVLSSYLSSKTNSTDTLVLAANLLSIALQKLHSGDTIAWLKSFPLGVKAIGGLLTGGEDIASASSNILRNLIDNQLVDFESHQTNQVVNIDPESNAIASICSFFMSLLESFADIPNEHTLAVLSVLFLKLGRNSSLYMRNIVLKLAEIFNTANDNQCDTSHLHKCFGCAVAALGVEDILGFVPIIFDVENFTCSNMWLLPIIKKYTFGASLRYFIDHIVPIAKSLQKAAGKAKMLITGQDLQAHARGLWALLPAFCRHPTDISESFQSLSKLMLVQLKKNVSRHKVIAEALQELVRSRQYRPKYDAAIAESPERSSDILLEDDLLENRGLIPLSKKDANRNIKALSSQSNELLQALITLFLDSPPKNRLNLKIAISCLASISQSSSAKKIFISSLERFPLVKAVIESGDLSDASLDMPSSKSDESQWSLSLDLASCFVEGADDDFLCLIFKLAKHSLQAGDEIGVREACYTLSCIFKENPLFCSSNMDELVDLISNLKSPGDMASFHNRLTCLRILLVGVLKTSSDVENTTPFRILNCIILALKDSKEEARKIAYDELLEISSCLEDSSSANSCGLHYKLISMILGYFSGPSPHITSAAVAALSVLVYKEPDLCSNVPDLIPSVTSLLQGKAVEVIKAVLGFIKVLVSCLEGKDLHTFASVIMDGLLPWSSVSRHHFRAKVTVIIEILIRKCGFPAVKSVTPERYQPFIRKVSLNRQGKTISKKGDSEDKKQENSDVSTNGSNKRMRKETENDESGSRLNRQKRQKQSQVGYPSERVQRSEFRWSRKTKQFNERMAGRGGKSSKPQMKIEKAFGRGGTKGPRNRQQRR